MIPLFEQAHSLPLTSAEREILAYFETHLPAAVYMSLNELSQKLYTSNATIVRFCQKLGLGGYNEFKYRVRGELRQQRTPLFASDDLIRHSVAQFQDNIQTMDIGKLQEAVGLLTSGRPLYIYGSNLSSLAARYLQMILTTLDYPSVLIEWEELLSVLTYELEPGAVFFIITAHGDSKSYLKVFEQMRKRSASIILLTCNPDSPLISLSTCWICTNDLNEEYLHVDVNTRFGIFTVIQVLIELISNAVAKRDQAYKIKDSDTL